MILAYFSSDAETVEEPFHVALEVEIDLSGTFVIGASLVRNVDKPATRFFAAITRSDTETSQA